MDRSFVFNNSKSDLVRIKPNDPTPNSVRIKAQFAGLEATASAQGRVGGIVDKSL